MGAPKGNTNALKHGLYAKHFSPEEQAWLRKMSPRDFRHEYYMMRVAVNAVFEIQQRIRTRMNSRLDSPNPEDEEALAKITNSLSLAITTLNTTARTYALFSGMDTTLNDPLDEALRNLPVFLEDKYLKETEEEEEEILIGEDEG